MSASEPKLIQDARGLSSGTIGMLIDDTRYVVIDKVQADFVEFCQENHHRYTTWVDAWHSFADILYKINPANPFSKPPLNG